MEDDGVYDLGEAHTPRPRGAFAPKIRRARRRPAPMATPASSLPALAASISLLAPGVGQLVLGEPRLGLFFATGVAFLGSLGWAIVAGIDRLAPTLELLGAPRGAVLAALAAVLVGGCALHAASVLHAHRAASASCAPSVPHPVLAALASSTVPGWGQVLGGHLGRAASFLAAAWLLAASWLAVSPLSSRVLEMTGTPLPAEVREGMGPVVLVSLSAGTWAVSVYDAVMGARSARRR